MTLHTFNAYWLASEQVLKFYKCPLFFLFLIKIGCCKCALINLLVSNYFSDLLLFICILLFFRSGHVYIFESILSILTYFLITADLNVCEITVRIYYLFVLNESKYITIYLYNKLYKYIHKIYYIIKKYYIIF
jgi:hypothetical protein